MSEYDVKPATESFKELKARLQEEQAGKTKEDIVRETGGIDLDNLPQIAKDGAVHVWVKRGIKISCEGGNHPHHSHFLVHR